MANRAYSGFSTRRTRQSAPIPGSTQVENSAGGFSWQVDKWERFKRFLILGAEGGTYYIGQQKLVEENAQAMVECVAEDAQQALSLVAQISYEGRAAKQDPVLFALAYIISHADVQTRRDAAEVLPVIARTGTMLFTFVGYALQFRSWGPVLRRAVANWYTRHNNLPLQLVKYRQRDNFTHKRLLNVSHVNPDGDAELATLLRWAHGDYDGDIDLLPRVIKGFEKVRRAESPKDAAAIVKAYHLPWEAVPTEFLNSPHVLYELLQDMPVMATIRQLPKLTAAGVLSPADWKTVDMVVERIKHVQEAKVHPLQILIAGKTYGSGHGFKGSLTWNPVSQIEDALDEAFYLAFGNVEPTGKTIVMGLDVSASMDWPQNAIAGTNLTSREAAVAMAMVTTAVEQRVVTLAFSHELIQFRIKQRQALQDVIKDIQRLPHGGTDCALPILGAMQQEIPVDAFLTYTDNETWYGDIHPAQALKEYRRKWNTNAKSVVIGMASNGFSIADPNDAGMMDVVGFDTSAPQVISDFITS